MPKTEETEETAAARRLIQAGIKNADVVTQSAGIRRVFRLIKGTGVNLTSPEAAKIFGLDELPAKED